jgi:Holliday junction resolvase RusA-like endonuclease
MSGLKIITGLREAVTVASGGFVVEIDVPPSLNNAYGNRKKGGRYLKDDARAWKLNAAKIINLSVASSRRIKGPYEVDLFLPAKMRGDTDNRIKLALDALVLSGRVPDDCKVTKVTASKCESVDPGAAILHVRAA